MFWFVAAVVQSFELYTFNPDWAAVRLKVFISPSPGFLEVRAFWGQSHRSAVLVEVFPLGWLFQSLGVPPLSKPWACIMGTCELSYFICSRSHLSYHPVSCKADISESVNLWTIPDSPGAFC